MGFSVEVVPRRIPRVKLNSSEEPGSPRVLAEYRGIGDWVLILRRLETLRGWSIFDGQAWMFRTVGRCERTRGRSFQIIFNCGVENSCRWGTGKEMWSEMEGIVVHCWILIRECSKLNEFNCLRTRCRWIGSKVELD